MMSSMKMMLTRTKMTMYKRKTMKRKWMTMEQASQIRNSCMAIAIILDLVLTMVKNMIKYR